MEDADDDLKAVFARMNPKLGVIDIWSFGRSTRERIAAHIALLAMLGSGPRSRFDEIVVVHPPGIPDCVGIQNLQALVPEAITELFPDVAPEAVRLISGRVSHIAAASFAVDDLLAALPAGGTVSRAVLILLAGRYREPRLQSVSPSGKIGGAENIWSLHVADLGRRLMTTAAERGVYILVDTGEDPPVHPDNRQRLLDVHDDCGIQLGAYRGGSVDDPTAQIADWTRLASEGRAGVALRLLEVSNWPDGMKASLRIQLLSLGGFKHQVVAEIRSRRDNGVLITPELNLLFAGAAHRANDDSAACACLGDAISGLMAREALLESLHLACRLNEEDLADAAADRIEHLFRDTKATLDYRISRRLDQGDLLGAAALLQSEDPSRASEAAAFAWLDQEFRKSCFEPVTVLEQARGVWPSLEGRIRQACTRRAQELGHYRAALNLVHDGLGSVVERREIMDLLYATEQVLLHAAEDDMAESVEAIAMTVNVAAAFAARHPTDTDVRSRLSRLISTKGSGQAGQVALLYLLDIALAEAPDVGPEADRPREATQQEVDDFLAVAESWLRAEGTVPIGRARFPVETLPANFHGGVAWAMIGDLERKSGSWIAQGQEETAHVLVTLVAAVAPHLTGDDRALDVRTVKLLADRLGQANRKQRARDVIETVLEIADARPEVARSAWFAYGDAYRQASDVREAALSFLCGLSLDQPQSATEAWYETLELVRFMREVQNLSGAEALIYRAAAFLKRSGRLADYDHRLATLRLQVAMLRLLLSSPINAKEVSRLLIEVAANAEQVFEREDDVGPVMAILIELVRQADLLGLPVDSSIRALTKRGFGQMAGGLEDRLSRFAKEAPDLDDLRKAAQELGGTRFAADASRDGGELTRLARRYLSAVHDETPPEDVLYATELLTDHTATAYIALGDDMTYVFPTDPTAVAGIAKGVSLSGVGVVLLGLDSDARLVRTMVEDGKVQHPVVEPVSTFDEARHRRWSQIDNLPYDYGFIYDRRIPDDVIPTPAESIRRFDASLTGLGFGGLPPQRALVIPDVDLANLPFNLLKIDGQFAALTTNIASAPSLAWVECATTNRNRPAGSAVCWIPTEGDPLLPLPVLAARLQPTLSAAGIALETSETPAAALKGAELAIVGAHGGIRMEQGRFFRSVRDETHRVHSARGLAAALDGSKVAILFVCSGGRLDLDPEDHTTVGLVNLLLERGCSAVLGSPWPMSASIPVYWLPAFLEAWELGFPLIDANAHANEAVLKNLGDRPDYRFAMHLHGDPLVVRNR